MRLLVTCFRTAQGRTLFMEGTRPSTVNSIGMFDMLKGVGMITIVLAHTAELYPMQISGGLSLTAFFPFIYREALMAAFFIASGYGFRKRSIGKCTSSSSERCSSPTASRRRALRYCICCATTWRSITSPAASPRPSRWRRLSAGAAPHHYLCRAAVLFHRPHVVSALAADRLGAAGRHLNIFPEKYTHWAVLGIMLLGWAPHWCGSCPSAFRRGP